MKFIYTLSLAAIVLTARADGDTDRAALVAANAGFAFNLTRQIATAKPEANVFISPYSAFSALQMAAAGAAGQTKSEMERVLGTEGMATDSVAPACLALDTQLASHQDVVTLNLANGLWYQRDVQLKPAFEEVNRKYFQAGLEGVDFGSPESARQINDWADRQTHGKIQNVVSYPFPPLTRLILANAIYFKGEWEEPFKKNLTHPREFHPASGNAKQTPMMTQAGHFLYQETADFQAVKLPYKGGLQMELYLPAAGSSPLKLLPLVAARDKVEPGFSRREGSVTLPKFRMDYSVQLNEALAALGMKTAFTSEADFSGIASEKLCLNEVRQKSYVDVNEEGTEAAAVTTVQITAMEVHRPSPDRFNLVLDRPFFFIISEQGTGAILFTGIMNNPAGS